VLELAEVPVRRTEDVEGDRLAPLVFDGAPQLDCGPEVVDRLLVLAQLVLRGPESGEERGFPELLSAFPGGGQADLV
jgi:hypothetical protein